MLRILLIILVALAVIIGLMRLTGARSGDAAPAAAGATVEEGAIEPAPATEDYIVDEPATDSLDVPAAVEDETPLETIIPDAGETVAGDADEAPSEQPTVEPQPENAATPIEPSPVEPSPVEPAPDAAAPPAGESNQPGL